MGADVRPIYGPSLIKSVRVDPARDPDAGGVFTVAAANHTHPFDMRITGTEPHHHDAAGLRATAPTFSGTSARLLPPYYKLCFIIKK
jgi:hypothetical protein